VKTASNVGIGRLRIVALVTSMMMIAAVISATLGSILPRTTNPDISPQLYLPQTLLGAVPFSLAAVLIILAVWGLGMGGVRRSQSLVTLIRNVAAFALVPMAIGGFWVGIGMAFGGIEPNSPASVALGVYELTFLATLLADIVLLIVALRVGSRSEESRGP
jgi:hypothetical protein